MKTLKPATIIPASLYVEREADRQLRRVLEDMGRPGYVLVARQMGKTNLLLHAKRECEDAQNIFAYLDLSSAYRTARECFRAIVDNIVEVNSHAFGGMAERFGRERASRDLPPHKEHESELRALLAAISGKLVIILDEIDALTRCDYSDQIFAQIRSTYFARVNFPDYARLTYVLSGVAEPTDIIKNPNLSPFNIGEKIYLDDFTPREFRSFIAKAGLEFPAAVVERIEHWAGGNPRITWDICSELEDRLLEGREIGPEAVDESAYKLYLASFDRPPVDHIRTLVESDKLIRSAVVQIRYGKAEALSDAVRNRLYLAGIIKADTRRVAIKNPVVDAALSDQWLKDVEVRKSGALSTAWSAILDRRYGDAIAMLREYVAGGGADEQGLRNANYYLGVAYLRSEQYREAVPAIIAGLVDKTSYSAVYCEQIYQLGVCYVRLGDLQTAKMRFEELVKEPSGNDYYLRALLALASIYLTSDFDALKSKVVEYCLEVIREAGAQEERSGREVAKQLRAAARVSLAKCYMRAGDGAAARAALVGAADDALPEERPRVLLEQYRVESVREGKDELLPLMVDAVVTAGLDVAPTQADTYLAFDAATLDGILLVLHRAARGELFSRLLEYVSSKSASPLRRRGELLYSLAQWALASGDVEACRVFVSDAWSNYVEGGGAGREAAGIAKLYAWADARAPEAVFENYMVQFMAANAPVALDWMDVAIFARKVQELQAKGEHEAARRVLKPALERQEAGPPLHGVILQFFSMRSSAALGDLVAKRQAADEILRWAPQVTSEAAGRRLLDAKTLKLIVREAKENARTGEAPARSSIRKVGRNVRVRVRYADGRVVEEKFKKLQQDIERGACELLD